MFESAGELRGRATTQLPPAAEYPDTQTFKNSTLSAFVHSYHTWASLIVWK